jgi:hypothetical protein
MPELPIDTQACSLSTASPKMESIKQPEILKQGVLGKQGGGAGGHKNWKDRYFVLSDHLYYYTNQQVSSIRTCELPLCVRVADKCVRARNLYGRNNDCL